MIYLVFVESDIKQYIPIPSEILMFKFYAIIASKMH